MNIFARMSGLVKPNTKLFSRNRESVTNTVAAGETLRPLLGTPTGAEAEVLGLVVLPVGADIAGSLDPHQPRLAVIRGKWEVISVKLICGLCGEK